MNSIFKIQYSKLLKRVTCLILIACFLPVALFADIIYLKNGKKVVGEIKKYRETQVGIQVEKNFYYIQKSEILKIEESEIYEPEFEINWAVVITTVILTGGLFGLAIWGREL